ncbi:MAG: hypothetical protein MRY64_12385 [Hyphomonadaceae bacterium]|nr:hypothetical protein [Hyphomonadaceae bacterium]
MAEIMGHFRGSFVSEILKTRHRARWGKNQFINNYNALNAIDRRSHSHDQNGAAQCTLTL